MKTKLLFSLIALTFFLASCDKDDTGPKAPTVVGKWELEYSHSFFKAWLDSTTTQEADYVTYPQDAIHLDFHTLYSQDIFKIVYYGTNSGYPTYTETNQYEIQGNKIIRTDFIGSGRDFSSKVYYIDTLTTNRLVIRDTTMLTETRRVKIYKLNRMK